MLASLLNWGLSLILGGLQVLALAERRELKMDYRAAAAAAYLGLGATWAMGLSSSAAQLQANAGSLPKSLLPITGVIPFSETIFLWQSIVVSVVLVSVSVVIAVWSAPGPDTALTAEAMNIKVERDVTDDLPPPQQPGEWLEYSAVLGFFIPSGGGKWLLEAPYVMQATNDLKVHLGWAVQVYNAAEALPNLITPFWMLPLLGVLGLKARDIVGFTFLQLLVHLPLVLFLLWALAYTLEYHPLVIP